ncbi:hypothetical protein Tco_0174293 [Tanacetum coccineum]
MRRYELKRREKGMIVEESRSTPSPTPIRSPRIYIDLVSSDTEKLQELTKTDTNTTPCIKFTQHIQVYLPQTDLSLFKAKPAHRAFQGCKREGKFPEQLKFKVPEYSQKGLPLKVPLGGKAERKFLASLHPRKYRHLSSQSCQRDPEARMHQSPDKSKLLYLKKGNTGPEK